MEKRLCMLFDRSISNFTTTMTSLKSQQHTESFHLLSSILLTSPVEFTDKRSNKPYRATLSKSTLVIPCLEAKNWSVNNISNISLILWKESRVKAFYAPGDRDPNQLRSSMIIRF